MSELVETVVPEVAPGISQPIQMRTNELVAGVRSDVGVIVYGPDLETLPRPRPAVSRQLRGIPGVVDPASSSSRASSTCASIPDRPSSRATA
jgi:cobalt-zinc-cadmium resistance protein CzcA